jgi:hypothetical protein
LQCLGLRSSRSTAADNRSAFSRRKHSRSPSEPTRAERVRRRVEQVLVPHCTRSMAEGRLIARISINPLSVVNQATLIGLAGRNRSGAHSVRGRAAGSASPSIVGGEPEPVAGARAPSGNAASRMAATATACWGFVPRHGSAADSTSAIEWSPQKPRTAPSSLIRRPGAAGCREPIVKLEWVNSSDASRKTRPIASAHRFGFHI